METEIMKIGVISISEELLCKPSKESQKTILWKFKRNG